VDIGGKKVKFLHKIPLDPMTGKNEWGVRSSSDDFDSTSSNGDNVFDVYSTSENTALNGTKYSDW
jgi:general secretion pathway protein G